MKNFLFVALAALAAAPAAAKTYTIDADHSAVAFKIRHLGSKVKLLPLSYPLSGAGKGRGARCRIAFAPIGRSAPGWIGKRQGGNPFVTWI